MFRLFVILLFLLSSLFAMSDTALLKRANNYAKSSSKTSQFQAYNDYKNLYLRALMNDDNYLQRSALVGIVKSGRRLHIDVARYAKELKKVKITKKKVQKIKVQKSNRLKRIHWVNRELVLAFDKKLDSKHINYFTRYDSKKRRYLYVFDIHASMLKKSQRIKKRGIDSIKLVQYSPSTVRLTIANRKRVDLHFKKSANALMVQINSMKRVVKQTHSKKKKKSTPRIIYPYSHQKIIVIDPGHGGKDSGAIGYRGYKEKNVVLKIAKYFRDILRKRGYKTYMTRDRDVFVTLRNRTKFANRRHADLFISIHANAVAKKDRTKAFGIESYFLSPSRSSRAKRVAAMENKTDLVDMNLYGKECFLNTLNSHNIIAANKLAINLQAGALTSLRKKYNNVVDAGVREGPFWVLVGAQMPAVLVETGFITNPTEAKRLTNSNYQKTFALGLANGVERYFINN